MTHCQILKQANVQYSDLNTAYLAACLLDIPVRACSIDNLGQWKNLLSGAEGILTVPIGSVEFIRSAIDVAGLREPQPMSYPESLHPFLHREIRITTAGEANYGQFVKPVATKLFTGFVVPDLTKNLTPDEHTTEQYRVFLSLPKDTPVWISERVSFVSEHRVYIHNAKIVGVGRYDDGEDDALMPSDETVQEMVKTIESTGEAPAAYSIDVGVLSDGTTALVECNDAWALGYYRGSLSNKDYLIMLITRWAQICGRRPETP